MHSTPTTAGPSMTLDAMIVCPRIKIEATTRTAVDACPTQMSTVVDPTTTATASAFEDWLKHNQSDEFRVQAVSPWACVFGIRFGRAWSFYLQENATATIMRYVKKSSTEMVALNASRTQRQMKGTGAAVTAESQKVKTGPFSTTKTIYMTRQEVSRPLQIREFFPNGGGLIRITDQVRRI